MEYLVKFDTAGNRKATVIIGIHYTTDAERQKYIDDDYVPISEEEYQYYIGNRGQGDNGTGYIRDPETGKPISAPPVKEEPEPIEPVVDDVRLAAFEAMAEQEARLIVYGERLAALETALKGGEGK